MCRFGMRGRLWLLFGTMTWGGLFTCLMGVSSSSYGATMAFIVLAAIGIEVMLLPYIVTPWHRCLHLT